MADLPTTIRKFEFEFRIFISFGLVILISALSFTVFADRPLNAVAVGGLLGIPAPLARALGYLAAALFSAGASFLRIWSGSVLTSRRMMSFAVKTDALLSTGPYELVRNPIYLADLVAFTGFALCLPPIGLHRDRRQPRSPPQRICGSDPAASGRGDRVSHREGRSARPIV